MAGEAVVRENRPDPSLEKVRAIRCGAGSESESGKRGEPSGDARNAADEHIYIV